MEEATLVLWLEGNSGGDAPEGALRLRSKSDLARGGGGDALAVSAQTGAGLPELLRQIEGRIFGAEVSSSEGATPTSQRQLEQLARAGRGVARALRQADEGLMELCASDLAGSAEALAQLSGEEQPDERMLDELFGAFCLGK